MTLAELLDTYELHADYAVTGDVASARAFAVACRRLLVRFPRMSRHNGTEEVQFDPAMIRQELQQAEAWLAAYDPERVAARATHFDLRGLR